jgi:ubiquinone/menaquinone biosynthesis C-methylase UbiE
MDSQFTSEVDEELSNKIKESWSSFQGLYEKTIEYATLQSSTILYNMTKAHEGERIVEVGVGCGKSTRMFIAELMKRPSVLFASDIAPGMVEAFQQRFSETDSAFNPKVNHKMLEEKDMHDPEALIAEMGDDIERKIFSTVANNEKLPFPDDCFDKYIASLSLMITGNHHNMLAEAYRVLQTGGVAGFTVWGRLENSELFTLVPELFKKRGVALSKSAAKSSFHLNNADDLEKDIRRAGFSEVKVYYSPANANFNSVDDVYHFFTNIPSFKPTFDTLTEEQTELIKGDMIEAFTERFGPSSTKPMTWEVLVCIAKK